MAIEQQGATGAATQPKGIKNSAINNLDPAKYTSLGDFIDEVNAPDMRSSLIKTFGDQGISGFLKMTGAVTSQGSADEVTYWEEARLHEAQEIVGTTIAAGKSMTIAAGIADASTADHKTALVLRVGDIIIWVGGERAYVSSTTPTDGAFTVVALLDTNLTALTAADFTLPIVGNMYAQGTDQPGRYLESNVVQRTNPYAIVKEVFKVSGSQATNVGYINLGNGDYRWYLKGEMDTRQRFLDKREMTMILGQKATNDTITAGTINIAGTEGYFSAIEDRGLVTTEDYGAAATAALASLDTLLVEMDKNGCPAEYAMYVNSQTSLDFDDMLAGQHSGGGLANAYGAFNNDKDMAVNLGFKSFSRGGYTFHKHGWKLLNDPTLLGAGNTDYLGAMVPLAKVTDAKSGAKVSALEMNYKSTNGYSRELEHWVTGGGVLGFNQNGKDIAEFNYRSECNLVTRAANQHVILKSA